MFIDPHVHCRDGNESYKETIAHALSVAERAGFTAIFDMPNTDPPIISRQQAAERIKLSKKANSPVLYGLHMALTADADQVRQAVDAYDEFPEVVGFKLYAGHSVGNIGITSLEQQRHIYQTLVMCGYRGVIAVHCEKDDMINRELWDPENPVTHANSRPPEAEIAAVKDQVQLAIDYGFRGTLHIVHISVPEAVDLVDEARRKIRVTCGATPHHLLLDTGRLQMPDGLLYKMNPPLRPEGMPGKLFSYLKHGKIDWIETDHAPHTMKEKTAAPFMSGMPSLHYYPRFVNWLRKNGFSEQQIKDLTFDNVSKAYGMQVKQRQCEPSTNLGNEYPYDPFKGVF